MKSFLSRLSARSARTWFVPFSLSVYCLLLSSSASAVDTTFSALEVVDYKGLPTFSASTLPVTVTGVVINNPLDISDGSGWWEVYVQALPEGAYGGHYVAGGDYGGSAVYMHRYGKNYTDAQWNAEKARVNYPMYNGSITTTALKYGDIVTIEAKAPGMEHSGKFNINDKHLKDEEHQFNFTILDRGMSPAYTTIELDNLKDANNQFLFDTDRQLADNCERYQGSLVHLDNLILDSGTWAPDGTVVVKQLGLGNRTFDLKLGVGSDGSGLFTSLIKSQVQSNPFSVTAILDQEDPGTTVGGITYYTSGYRLWLTNVSGLTTVPEPGAMAMLTIGLISLLAYAWRRRK